MPFKEITELQNTIRATEGCESWWEASIKVTEQLHNGTGWSGVVEVFALVDHPRAKHAYGWTYLDGNEKRTTVVLKLPPVDSPQTAIRIATSSKS
jgi:hypothetical protein